VLADDAGTVGEAGVDHDPLALLEALDAVADFGDDPGAVGAEDARLRDGGEALPEPEVEMVERGRAQANEDFSPPRARVLDLVEAQDLGAAVLVDPNRLDGRESNAGTLTA
jgi:hypothetical protein